MVISFNLCDNLLDSSRFFSLHVHRDLPALSGYGEAEQQQCGKVTWGFPHWAPEERQENNSII